MASAISQILGSTLQNSFLRGGLFCSLIAITFSIARFLSDRRRNPSRLPLPPGPKGYPLIGNVLDMPTSKQWLKYAEWAKTYGDVFSFEALGLRIIVLNSLEATRELFEKRSANYSDRPRSPMMLELMRFDFSFGGLPYGARWRKHRRLFNEYFRANAVSKYQSVQGHETRAFLNRLLHRPEDFLSHIRHALASSILRIVYGIKISGSDDPYVANVEESIEGLNAAAMPGMFLVDLIPMLMYVPSWFPGAGFKRFGAHLAEVNRKVVELPFNHVAQQLKEGIDVPSSIAATIITALDNGDKQSQTERITVAQNVTAVTYLAASDTTFSAIQSFFLAMAMYPATQRKAQAELDAAIGPHRLPEASDRESLPYVNALIKETLRWHSVVPLGVPHMATEDDVYNGYFIPKGAIVIGNSWPILNDDKVFTEPEEFIPERYLKDGQLDLSVRQPEAGVFGFGRRICPGRYLADDTLFHIVSSTLLLFNITPAIDENGVPLPLSKEMTSGLVSYPVPFKVDIKPRSPSAEILVRAESSEED